MNVLVFSTSVSSSTQVMALKPLLDSLAGNGQWNFALDDHDRVLRITSSRVKPQKAIELLRQFGYECEELD